jgi:hypothetical protein
VNRAIQQIKIYQTGITLNTADLPGVAMAAAELFCYKKLQEEINNGQSCG